MPELTSERLVFAPFGSLCPRCEFNLFAVRSSGSTGGSRSTTGDIILVAERLFELEISGGLPPAFVVVETALVTLQSKVQRFEKGAGLSLGRGFVHALLQGDNDDDEGWVDALLD